MEKFQLSSFEFQEHTLGNCSLDLSESLKLILET